jgi:hypothetical protein
MKSLTILMALLIILFLTGCGPSSHTVEPIGAGIAKSQSTADVITLPEPGQETARMLMLLEREAVGTGVAGNGDYYYSDETVTSRNQDSAIQQAYQRAVANLVGKLPVGIKHSDIAGIIEKTDETVTQSGNFWKAVVKVRVAKSDIAALLPDTAGARKPRTEVAAGIVTDGDFYYVYGSDTSKSMSLSLNKAKHDANVRLAQYLGGSTNVEISISGGQTMKQSIAQRSGIWLAEVIMKAPVALNKKNPGAESTAMDMSH